MTRFDRWSTVQMGGGTPRAHDTEPASAKDESKPRFESWYVASTNAAEVQKFNAILRDADNAAYNAARNAGGYVQHDWNGDNGRLGACDLRPDSPRRIAAETAIEDANRLRATRPIPVASPLRRHEDALAALPTLQYIREWGRQWKAARNANRNNRRTP